MFAKLIPEIIKEGRLYFIQIPLYGTGKNAKFKPIWTTDELKEVQSTGKDIRRFKGLGKFNSNELRELTMGKQRRLIQIEWADNFKDISKVFMNSVDRRELINSDLKPFMES